MLVAVVTPPPQLNAAPVTGDEAVSAALIVAQVKVAGAAMLTPGVVMF